MSAIEDYQQISILIENFLNSSEIFELNLIENTLNDTSELKVAGEIFQNYLPISLPPEIRRDLTYLFLYKISKPPLKTKIITEWSKLTNSSPDDATKITYEFPDGTAYRAVYDLLLYDQMTNGLFLPSIINNLKDLKKYDYTLSLKDACDYLKLHSLISFHHPLTETDIRIIELLSKDPTISNLEISKRLGISRNTVSTKINVLCDHGCLFFNAQVNF
ncbi:MAG: winged helix-turn-helix domain-containing protein, partial [Candidatus Odinarchaeia archaeon]